MRANICSADFVALGRGLPGSYVEKNAYKHDLLEYREICFRRFNRMARLCQIFHKFDIAKLAMEGEIYPRSHDINKCPSMVLIPCVNSFSYHTLGRQIVPPHF